VDIKENNFSSIQVSVSTFLSCEILVTKQLNEPIESYKYSVITFYNLFSQHCIHLLLNTYVCIVLLTINEIIHGLRFILKVCTNTFIERI